MVFVWCLCGVCVVPVWCLCGACAVFVWCLCGACVVFVSCLCGACVVFVLCVVYLQGRGNSQHWHHTLYSIRASIYQLYSRQLKYH